MGLPFPSPPTPLLGGWSQVNKPFEAQTPQAGASPGSGPALQEGNSNCSAWASHALLPSPEQGTGHYFCRAQEQPGRPAMLLRDTEPSSSCRSSAPRTAGPGTGFELQSPICPDTRSLKQSQKLGWNPARATGKAGTWLQHCSLPSALSLPPPVLHWNSQHSVPPEPWLMVTDPSGKRLPSHP